MKEGENRGEKKMTSVESALAGCFSDGSAALIKALAEHDVNVNVDGKDPLQAFIAASSAVVQHQELFVCSFLTGSQCHAFSLLYSTLCHS